MIHEWIKVTIYCLDAFAAQFAAKKNLHKGGFNIILAIN
jgi:hypothetical protein